MFAMKAVRVRYKGLLSSCSASAEVKMFDNRKNTKGGHSWLPRKSEGVPEACNSVGVGEVGYIPFSMVNELRVRKREQLSEEPEADGVSCEAFPPRGEDSNKESGWWKRKRS